MMRRNLWIGIGAVLIVAGIATAWTQTEQWHRGRGAFWFHRGPMGYVARALDLSDDQNSQIKSICENERPNIAVLVHELASEQREMDALTFQSGTPDQGKIEDVATRQGATVAKLFAEKEKVTGEIYSQVLNPQQRTKADDLQKHWNSRLDQIANRIGDTRIRFHSEK